MHICPHMYSLTLTKAARECGVPRAKKKSKTHKQSVSYGVFVLVRRSGRSFEKRCVLDVRGFRLHAVKRQMGFQRGSTSGRSSVPRGGHRNGGCGFEQCVVYWGPCANLCAFKRFSCFSFLLNYIFSFWMNSLANAAN